MICRACQRPKLLDAFACEGGAGEGYRQAGFCVDAVDLDRTRLNRYRIDCDGARKVHGDAIDFIGNEGHRYAARHASPPCQAYSITRHSHHTPHPELIEPTRTALVAVGGPYVIENVPGAPLLNPITLCGASFGLTALDTDGSRLVLKRHRLFESNIWLWSQECGCALYRDRGYKVAGSYGGGSVDRRHAEEVRRGGYTPPIPIQRVLLGIDWMTGKGLRQSIPPAYTRFIGEQLLLGAL